MAVKVDAVIPVLNEEEALPRVLDEIPKEWVRGVVVVDNGSTDRTAQRARERGASVVYEPEKGYGAAVQRGLAELAKRNPEPDGVVFLDGDHSDYPEKIPCLIGPILKGEADFVLGSRVRRMREHGAMPWWSDWGNQAVCRLMNALWKTNYSDLGPFRAIRWDCLRQLEMADRDFGWTIEMQIKAAQAGLRIKEIPVPYRRRIGASKISGTFNGSVGAGYKILYTLVRYGFCRRRAATRI